jgi:hypothetical protein
MEHNMKYVIALTAGPGCPWTIGDRLLKLGEIENMRGHGVYMLINGKICDGYHPNNFFEYKNFHYNGYTISDFMVTSGGNIFLPTKLVDLLTELNESHTPEAAEKSFLMQAINMM